ncbi:HlyD family secretion protein [Anaerolinea thermophila]|uniref:Secretion protein HlyD family protein n=1 Tax=Anaerolinea thermophila (strain DSM 14523 / JCM 11388 / NBRC 100420 / UNI-1) TaxID=926569 RepID=E8N0B9_ANATU|nr:efflux RND transporter periplasmic adaptor subunit [Anaerolinea thermophila]BAJ64668.1 secretion protein HlyD family protein [Anaerolinea thermophila UNI-1]
MHRFLRSFPILLFIFVVGLSGCNPAGITPQATPLSANDLADSTITASGTVIPAQYQWVGFESGGTLRELLVATGDTVSPGQILARLDETILRAAVTQAKAALIRARNIRNELEELPKEDSRAAAVAAVASAEANLDRLERSGARQIEIDAAKAQLESARASLKALEEGASRAQITQADADVEAAQAALEQAEAALRSATLQAPFGGQVVEIAPKVGDVLAPGQPIILLADLSKMQVETTDLSEVDVAQIAIGDDVLVTFDALEGITVRGKVVKIALKAAPGVNVTYPVTIELENPPQSLRWGMTAFIKIQP